MMENTTILTKSIDPNDVAALALQTIDSAATLSSQYMTFTAIILAVSAVLGFSVLLAAVRWYAKDAGRKCAHERMEKYVSDGEAGELIEFLVQKAVREEMEKRIFTQIHPHERPAAQDEQGFDLDPRIRRMPPR